MAILIREGIAPYGDILFNIDGNYEFPAGKPTILMVG